MVAFGFFRKSGSTSARFLRGISYLLYGDILFWSAFETDLHFLAGVNEELVVVQKETTINASQMPALSKTHLG